MRPAQRRPRDVDARITGASEVPAPRWISNPRITGSDHQHASSRLRTSSSGSARADERAHWRPHLCRGRDGGPREVSLVGESGEGLFGVAVPIHRLLGVAPAALHGIAGLLVGRVAGLLRLIEVAVLGLDHIVGALSAVLQVAGPSEGLAGHGLHGRLLLMGCPDLLTIETGRV